MPYQSNRKQLQQRIAQAAAEGLTQADLMIEAAAKAELYPGHGKRTGTLQRSIVGEPGRVTSPIRVAGRVATKGVPYARRIERRYGYLKGGYGKARDRIRRVVSERIRREIGS